MSKITWPLEMETERLILRPLNLEDVDFVLSHFSNKQVNRYLYDEPPLKSKDEAFELIAFYDHFETKSYCRWVIVQKNTGKPMGTCGFHLHDSKNQIIELGYDLTPEYWQKGYMKEALSCLLEMAFKRDDINRIQAFIALENKASFQLLQALDFKQEGIIRDKHYLNGLYYDHYSYSKLKKDQTIYKEDL